MNNQKFIEHIKKSSWYRQGGVARLFYVFYPYHGIHETVAYTSCIIYQKGEVSTAFFDRDREIKKTRELIQKVCQDSMYMERWISAWRRDSQKLLKFCEDYFCQKPVDQWTNNELVSFLNNYKFLILKEWKKGILCEWTDPGSMDIIKEKIKEMDVNLSDKEISLLIAPKKLTFLQEELRDRIIIIKKKRAGKNIDKDLENHVQLYNWIEDNWAYVNNLDIDYFRKKIEGNMKEFEKIENDFKNLRNRLLNNKKKRDLLLKVKKIPQEIINIFDLFSKIADWRDERKKNGCCLPNQYLFIILKRLMKENSLSENIAGHLIFSEVNGWKLSSDVIKNLYERNQGWIYYYLDKNRYFHRYGQEANNIFELLNKGLIKPKLSGAVANRGKVSGKVCIVETKEDFAKMQQGYILVARMTRPEYMPILKIASAIITDEGGITSHAAIVSRELDIPCIIGTQIATEILKDGDMVDVDAYSGVVTKI